SNGIGDITQSFFVSPTHPGQLIWGVGPVFTIPSANDPILWTGKFLFGPTAVFLTTPGHWVIGVLLNNQHGGGLVPDHGTHYHFELARGIGRAVDRAGRRRIRSGFQDWRSASERVARRLLQRNTSDGHSELAIAGFA